MKQSNKSRTAALKKTACTWTAALCLGATLGAAPTAFAQADGFKQLVEIGAGIACEFPLRIEYRGEGNVYKEFLDADGKVVRIISAGSKVDYRLTNMLTHAQLVINGRGAMSKTDYARDGSTTTAVHGHTVVIFFPTDIPAGPSTTEYVGRVVYTTNAAGVSVLRETSGQKSDLCAKLGSAG